MEGPALSSAMAEHDTSIPTNAQLVSAMECSVLGGNACLLGEDGHGEPLGVPGLLAR